MMEAIIQQAKIALENSCFNWAVCGGGAIDLFVGKPTRAHQDLDLAVFWEDRPDIIRYMLDLDWRVVEACSGGVVHELFDVSDKACSLFCFPPTNTGCQLEPMGDCYYRFKLGFEEQTDFDYVEFLFNRREDGCFCYSQNNSIKRSMDKAILKLNGIPVLAPEIALLYKSIYYLYINTPKAHADQRVRNHRHDFAVSLPLLDQEQKLWLKSALEIEYKDGHEWLELFNE